MHSAFDGSRHPSPVTVHTVLWCILLFLIGGTTGCRSTEGNMAGADRSIEVIVRAGRERAQMHDGVEQRSGHFVLLADGSLHAGTPARRLPPRVRLLTRAETEEIERLIDAIERQEEGQGTPRSMAREIPSPSELVIAVEVRQADGAWMTVHRAASAEGPDPVLAALIRRLSQLAWLPDVEPDPRRLAPRRYDVGPDPHARYRAEPPAS